MRFFGFWYITDHLGEMVVEASEDERQVLVKRSIPAQRDVTVICGIYAEIATLICMERA